MDFAKLLRDAFRETIGFVGACAFYLVAPLRWPLRWAERVSDPRTPSAQGYVETRLFFFLTVAAWIVFIHVFLPPVGTAAGPAGGAIDAQRQQVLDTFVQAFAGGMRGAAATGLALGGVLATAILDAWLRLRWPDRDGRRVDLVVVALGVINVYVFAIARVVAYLGRESVAAGLAEVARMANAVDWPRPIEMALSVGAGGATRNLVLVTVLAILLLLHLAMAWVLWSPLRLSPAATADPAPAATDASEPPPAAAPPAALRRSLAFPAVAGFATVCLGLLAAEAIREGQPRLGEVALVPDAAGEARSCFALVTLVNDGERPLLITRGQYIDLRVRVATGRSGPWSPALDYAATIARINGKTEDGVLVKPGETALLATAPLRPTRPTRLPPEFLASTRFQQVRMLASFETWLGGGSRVLRLAPFSRRLDEAALCLPELGQRP